MSAIPTAEAILDHMKTLDLTCPVSRSPDMLRSQGTVMAANAMRKLST